MKIRMKKIYLIAVPLFLIAGFLYGGLSALEMRESEIFFPVLQNEQYRFWLIGAFKGYLWAARVSGFFLILDYIVENRQKGGKAQASMLVLAVFGCVFVGVPTLIPCYIINLAAFVKERKSGVYQVQTDKGKNKYGLVIILTIVLVLLAAAGGRKILAGRDAGKMKVYQATIWNEAAREEENEKTEVIFYDTAQNAVNAFWKEEGPEKLEYPNAGNEVFRCSYEDQCFCIWAGKSVADVPYMIGFCFEVKGDLYSYPEYAFWQQIDGSDVRMGTYDDGQRVVRDIVASYRHVRETQKSNENIPLYFGVCKGDDTKNLSILDHKPDEVKEFEYEGKRYYFWYYTDGSFIQKRIKEREGFKEFSMNEAREYLDISFLA